MNTVTFELPDSSLDNARWPGKYLALYRPVEEERTYTLCAPLSYIADDGVIITARPGFTTDGASVPRLFWWYASPFAGPHAAAVVLHDILYSAKWRNRKAADEVFYEAMRTLPIRKSKAWAMYRSVRAAGDRAWNAKTRKQTTRARQLLDVRREL